MPFRGDICQYFDSKMFRYLLRKKYKRHKTFADRMGVTFQTVYGWSNGDHKPIWRSVMRMADIFGVPARQLLDKRGRTLLDKWEDHLMDYLFDPPEVVNETKTTEVDGQGNSTTINRIERSLKLTAKEAIDLSEKLGHFEGIESSGADEPTEEPYDPLKDLIEDE